MKICEFKLSDMRFQVFRWNFERSGHDRIGGKKIKIVTFRTYYSVKWRKETARRFYKLKLGSNGFMCAEYAYCYYQICKHAGKNFIEPKRKK